MGRLGIRLEIECCGIIEPAYEYSCGARARRRVAAIEELGTRTGAVDEFIQLVANDCYVRMSVSAPRQRDILSALVWLFLDMVQARHHGASVIIGVTECGERMCHIIAFQVSDRDSEYPTADLHKEVDRKDIYRLRGDIRRTSTCPSAVYCRIWRR